MNERDDFREFMLVFRRALMMIVTWIEQRYGLKQNDDALLSQVEVLREACVIARKWILHNDDMEGEGPMYELRLIENALEFSESATR
jgi:hypothetical protein